MPDQAREQLAAAQQQLLSDLANSTAADGFDAARLKLTARTLLNKRRRAVERSWPNLVRYFGSNFKKVFDQFALEHPEIINPIDAGLVLSKSVASQLPDPARLERLNHRLQRGWIAVERKRDRIGLIAGISFPWPISRQWIISLSR